MAITTNCGQIFDVCAANQVRIAALADRVAAEAADRARMAYIAYTQRTTQTVYCAVDALGSGVSGEGHRSWSA